MDSGLNTAGTSFIYTTLLSSWFPAALLNNMSYAKRGCGFAILTIYECDCSVSLVTAYRLLIFDSTFRAK